MMTQKRWTLPMLAAATLLVAACDPFPEAPGGSPTVVRVMAFSPNHDYDPVLVEGADITDPAAITLAAVPVDANLIVQFNKPMDGASIQATPDYLSDGTPVDSTTACDAAGSPLTLTGWPAGTLVCYDSATSTDGGQIRIVPGAALAVATSYGVAGTVQDWEGKTLAIDVTFTTVP